MDPSIFFGRSRVTRQTSKPKQLSTDKENLKSEVKSVKKKTTVNQKGSKGTLREVRNEAIPTRRNAVRGASQVGEKSVKSNDAAVVNSEKKVQESKTRKTVRFTEDDSNNADTQEVSSGPVYKNVRRSDVRDDPVDEYAFDESDSSSESAAPTKKKRKRQPQKKKSAKSVVKWDPSKKPVVVKPTKPKKSKPNETVVTSVTSNKTTNVKCKGAPSLTKEPIPTSEDRGAHRDKLCSASTKQQLLPSKQKETILKEPPVDTSLDFEVDSHFTSTPTTGKAPSRLITKHVGGKIGAILTPNQKNIVCQTSASVKLLNEIQTTSPVCSSPLASCSTSNKTSSTKQTLGKKPDTKSVEAKVANVSSHIESTVKNKLKSTPFRTPVRSPCISIPSICVRESPSFMETELEVPIEASPISCSSLPTKPLSNIPASPVTRSMTSENCNVLSSTPTPQLAATSSSPNNGSVSLSPAAAEEPSLQSADISKLFDDLPRTSVIPTRMFSTHRGTIFRPEVDNNVNKRKLPEVSPSKKLAGPRKTTVKFSVPQTSSGLDDCFGFDDDDSPFIPKSNPIPRHVMAPEEGKPKKPNLSIQDVQALIRGQLQFVSPSISTPRSIQTKLTDFVSSTPSTRSKQKPTQGVLTPTPVPLFGEENLDTELTSPFTQLSRRSYDRFRPAKRIACGDEVLSGDEADENDANQNTTETTGVEIKKKSRSYKKKKKPEEKQLDTWAQQMASHFDEVEDVELEIK